MLLYICYVFQSCIQHQYFVISFKMLVLYLLHWIIGHVDRFVMLTFILLILTWYQSIGSGHSPVSIFFSTVYHRGLTIHLVSTLALSWDLKWRWLNRIGDENASKMGTLNYLGIFNMAIKSASVQRKEEKAYKASGTVFSSKCLVFGFWYKN